MRAISFLISVLLLIFSLGCGSTSNNFNSVEGLSLETIPSEVIYNATRDIKMAIESDFLVKMVKIVNNTDETIDVKSMVFTIFSGDKEVFDLTYKSDELNVLFKKYVEKFESLPYDFAEGIFLGKLGVANLKKTSDSSLIEPGAEAGILNIPFKFFADKPATKCRIHVELLMGTNKVTKDMTLQVEQYTLNNKYIFPVKGAWMTINNYNANYGHRFNSSQEFAFDLVIQNPDLMMYTPSGKNEDYVCWGKEVVASADGTVVDCVDGVPNNPSFVGSRLSTEELNKVRDQLGPTAMVGGNYVIIEHQNSEFTFYAHMINGSVKVKKGDKVKQGQILGLCGNSGNSDAPHMHFHLMNGPSVINSRGLPITFTNIKDLMNGKINSITEPNMIVYAE